MNDLETLQEGQESNINDHQSSIKQGSSSLVGEHTPSPTEPQTSYADENFPDYPQSKKLSIDTSFAATLNTNIQGSKIRSAALLGRRRRGEYTNFTPTEKVGPLFRHTTQYFSIWNLDRTQSYRTTLIPKVDRGFFTADNEWCCYRRNYFQLSSAFSCVGNNTGEELQGPGYIEINNSLTSFSGFSICVSSKIANGEKKIELVQHTAKRDKGPQIIPSPRNVLPGGNPSQFNAGTGNIATFERLQFKTATANNVKRRAAQQFFILNIELYANLDDGSYLKIAVCESANLVVRGRSPGHYTDVQQERAMSNLNSAASIEGYPQRDEAYQIVESSSSAYPASIMSLDSPNMCSSPSMPYSAPLFGSKGNFSDYEYFGHAEDYHRQQSLVNNNHWNLTPLEAPESHHDPISISTIVNRNRSQSNPEDSSFTHFPGYTPYPMYARINPLSKTAPYLLADDSGIMPNNYLYDGKSSMMMAHSLLSPMTPSIEQQQQQSGYIKQGQQFQIGNLNSWGV